MNTVTRHLGRAVQIIATTTVALALTAGLAAAPASAATLPQAKLTITPIYNTDFYDVKIVGVFPMTQADAQGYLNNMGPNGGMRFTVWGDDPVPEVFPRYNRRYYGLAENNNPTTAALHATPDGLRYARTLVVPRSVLNEDDGYFDQKDEIYVNTFFIDGDNGERSGRTNVVSKQF